MGERVGGSEKLFCGMMWSRGFWFRIYGYGLHVSTRKRDDALFSERYGYRKAWYWCGLRFEPLRPMFAPTFDNDA